MDDGAWPLAGPCAWPGHKPALSRLLGSPLPVLRHPTPAAARTRRTLAAHAGHAAGGNADKTAGRRAAAGGASPPSKERAGKQ